MLKQILTPIVFFLFVCGLFFPGTVRAVCEIQVTDDCSGNLECTTDGATYCCSHQNECYNLQQKEGAGSSPIAPATAAPTASPCTGPNCSTGGGIPCDVGRGPAIKTAIGCIHTTPFEFVKDFMKFIIAISGGLAFLMMLLGAFQMLTSAGNPDSLNAGRERLTNAVIGLLFVIFAILLMQIIGVGILDIPGFK